ncbi:hypothetical protein L9F63_010520 [Diploptera punctata]|uniref:Gustatory receptor n=1 Tax=Diploptera punctata TaxID=6984 RepID=A0AAD8AIU9_DIPPU|nr:hypothetical protein L9F63_010520 [Diploptera punctata]
MKNYKRNAYELFLTVKPLFYASKLFGLAPISKKCLFEEEEMTKKQFFRNSDTIYTSTLIILIFVSTIFVFVNITPHTKEDELSNLGMHFLDFLIMGLATIINLTVSLIKVPNEMSKAFKKLTFLGEYLKIKGKRFSNYAKFIRRETYFVIIFYLVLWLTDVFIWCNNDCYWNMYVMMEDILNLVNVIVMLQFIDFVLLIRKCIQEINNSLTYSEMVVTDNLTESQWKLINKMYIYINNNRDYNEQHLSRATGLYYHSQYNRNFNESSCISALRVMQDTLCDVAMSVNSMYGLQVLVIFVTNFIQSTSNLNYFIINISPIRESSIQNVLLCISSLFWSVVHFMALFFIVMPCNLVSKESEQTAHLLQKILLMPDIKHTAALEIQQFAQQVMVRKLQFTAYDFFTLNYSILVSIIGGITTLIVIIV